MSKDSSKRSGRPPRKGRSPDKSSRGFDEVLQELFEAPFPGTVRIWAAVGLVSVYIIGFLVSMSHLSRFSLPSFDFLRVRYLSAGALFAVTLAPPVLAGVLWWREWLSIRDSSIPERILTTLFVSLGYPLPIWLLLLQATYVGRASAFSPAAVSWFISVAVWSALVFPLVKEQIGLKWREHSIRHLIRVTIYLFVFVGLTRGFALAFYPRMDPAIGGGGGTQVLLHLDRNGIPLKVARAVQDPVLVFDRSATSVRLIRVEGDSILGFEIPYSAVRAMQILGREAMPAASLREILPFGTAAASAIP